MLLIVIFEIYRTNCRKRHKKVYDSNKNNYNSFIYLDCDSNY